MSNDLTNRLRDALREIAAPFKLYDSETGQISFDELAKEFSRHQQVAGLALADAKWSEYSDNANPPKQP